MHYVNPTREQVKTIYGLPVEQPVCMVNLVRFRELAIYHPPTRADRGKVLSGRETYELYSAEAEIAFRNAGGKQLWLGQPQTTLIGPPSENWDLIFVARYPTVQAFIDLIKSAEYQSATRHRTAALEDSRLIVCAQLEASQSFAPVGYLASVA